MFNNIYTYIASSVSVVALSAYSYLVYNNYTNNYTNNESVNEPVNNKLANEPINNEPVNEVVNNEPFNEVVNNEPFNEVVNNEPFNEVVNNEPVNEVVNNEQDNKLVNIELVNELVNNKSINNELVNDSINNESINKPNNLNYEIVADEMINNKIDYKAEFYKYGTCNDIMIILKKKKTKDIFISYLGNMFYYSDVAQHLRETINKGRQISLMNLQRLIIYSMTPFYGNPLLNDEIMTTIYKLYYDLIKDVIKN
jgi:hypothetical protein